jgi:hypothetical protein
VEPQWSALFAGLTLSAKVPADTEVVLGIDTGLEPVRVTLRHTGFKIERHLGGKMEVTLRGSDHLVGAVLSGLLTVTEAIELGLTVTGRTDLLTDLVADQRRATGPTP